jgi:hypothetical protein
MRIYVGIMRGGRVQHWFLGFVIPNQTAVCMNQVKVFLTSQRHGKTAKPLTSSEVRQPCNRLTEARLAGDRKNHSCLSLRGRCFRSIRQRLAPPTHSAGGRTGNCTVFFPKTICSQRDDRTGNVLFCLNWVL